MAWLLASYLAGAITRDMDIKQWCYEMFERDLDGAREVHAADWAKRPLWQRAAELAVGVFDGNL